MKNLGAALIFKRGAALYGRAALKDQGIGPRGTAMDGLLRERSGGKEQGEQDGAGSAVGRTEMTIE